MKIMTPEVRREKVKELMEEYTRKGQRAPSYQTIASTLGVNPKTIQRDMATIQANTIKLRDEVIPQSEDAQEAVFAQAKSTLDTVQWVMKECADALTVLKEEMGLSSYADKCECCGRRTRTSDLRLSAFFKGMDSLMGQAELQAKLLGEITSSPQINVHAADRDYFLITSVVRQADADIAAKVLLIEAQLDQLGEELPQSKYRFDVIRKVLGELGSKPTGRILYAEISPRRMQRNPDFAQLEAGYIDAEYKEVYGE